MLDQQQDGRATYIDGAGAISRAQSLQLQIVQYLESTSRRTSPSIGGAEEQEAGISIVFIQSIIYNKSP
jgi:hypothetical protein